MILHNVMWESRPLPKIVRDPLAALSARGSFFMLFPLLAHGRLRKISRPACYSVVPGTTGDFFVGKEELGGLERTTKGARNSFCPTVFSQANKLG